jgi:hypothetical protein
VLRLQQQPFEKSQLAGKQSQIQSKHNKPAALQQQLSYTSSYSLVCRLLLNNIRPNLRQPNSNSLPVPLPELGTRKPKGAIIHQPNQPQSKSFLTTTMCCSVYSYMQQPSATAPPLHIQQLQHFKQQNKSTSTDGSLC